MSDQGPPPPKLAGISALLSDPLAGWGNDDLLITEQARNNARAENPEIFRVLDWEPLREAFSRFENAALKAKKDSRLFAVSGAAAAGAGSALLAVTPLFSPAIVPLLALIGLIATIVGGAASAFHLIQARGRDAWLANRAKAERLRQFYFQFYINNLSQACAAATDDTALAKLSEAQANALKRVLKKFADDEREYPTRILEDHLHSETWLESAWRGAADFGPKDSAPGHAILEALLDRLEAQRLKIQLRYTKANQQQKIMRPAGQHSALDFANNALSFAVIGAAIAGGWALLKQDSYALPLALLGAFGALGITVRILQHGLVLRADVERYDWYLQTINSALLRFAHGDTRQKILALRDFEGHAYGEMRQFLRAHHYESTF